MIFSPAKEKAFRDETQKRAFFMPKMLTCRSCNRRRSHLQFDAGNSVCRKCRGVK